MLPCRTAGMSQNLNRNIENRLPPVFYWHIFQGDAGNLPVSLLPIQACPRWMPAWVAPGAFNLPDIQIQNRPADALDAPGYCPCARGGQSGCRELSADWRGRGRVQPRPCGGGYLFHGARRRIPPALYQSSLTPKYRVRFESRTSLISRDSVLLLFRFSLDSPNAKPRAAPIRLMPCPGIPINSSAFSE